MQKNKTGIFIAYAWSAPMKIIYEPIIETLENQWDIFQGPELITQPSEQGEVERFRKRNKQLFDCFAEGIQKADIFIADVTELNPNVMIELGIAIKLNKNVLILSGVSKDKIPFDISGLHIDFYRNKEDLEKRINDFLDIYIKIKGMTFDAPVHGSYYHSDSDMISSPKECITSNLRTKKINPYTIQAPNVTIPRLKDLKIYVKFRIIEKFDDSDWFGLLLRAPMNLDYEPVKQGAILVYSRYNGCTDLIQYPDSTVIKTTKTNKPHDCKNYRTLNIELSGNRLIVNGEDNSLQFDEIKISQFGYLHLACFRSSVEIKDLKVLNIDTTTEII